MNDYANGITFSNKARRWRGFQDLNVGGGCSLNCHHGKHGTGDASRELQLRDREKCEKSKSDQSRREQPAFDKFDREYFAEVESG